MIDVKKNDDVIVIVAGIIVSLLVVLGVGIGAAYYQQTSLSQTHSAKITTKEFIKEIAPAAQAVEKKYGIPLRSSSPRPGPNPTGDGPN